MDQSLVARWIACTKPFDAEDYKEKFIQSYAKACKLDAQMTDALRKSMASLDHQEISKVISMFAEERFSEDALLAGVLFFESEVGKRYFEERRKVIDAAMDRINLIIAESLTKFGLL